MSYILEALKKAEAERNGIPAQVVRPPVFSATAQRRSAWRSPWPWTMASVIAFAVAGIFWYGQQEKAVPIAVSAPGVPAPAAPPLSVAQAPAPASPPTASTPVAAPTPESKRPAVPEEPTKSAPKPREPSTKEPAARKSAPKKTAEQSDVPKAATVEPPLATLRELPEHIQREIPPLSIGGYIYSGNKADRSVLINRRLLREGDEAAPGLKLEEMRPNGMVFSYKGYRYRASY